MANRIYFQIQYFFNKAKPRVKIYFVSNIFILLFK